jgi:hypothetical protein
MIKLLITICIILLLSSISYAKMIDISKYSNIEEHNFINSIHIKQVYQDGSVCILVYNLSTQVELNISCENFIKENKLGE